MFSRLFAGSRSVLSPGPRGSRKRWRAAGRVRGAAARGALLMGCNVWRAALRREALGSDAGALGTLARPFPALAGTTLAVDSC